VGKTFVRLNTWRPCRRVRVPVPTRWGNAASCCDQSLRLRPGEELDCNSPLKASCRVAAKNKHQLCFGNIENLGTTSSRSRERLPPWTPQHGSTCTALDSWPSLTQNRVPALTRRYSQSQHGGRLNAELPPLACALCVQTRKRSQLADPMSPRVLDTCSGAQRASAVGESRHCAPSSPYKPERCAQSGCPPPTPGVGAARSSYHPAGFATGHFCEAQPCSAWVQSNKKLTLCLRGPCVHWLCHARASKQQIDREDHHIRTWTVGGRHSA
jgi:hypothetical protein